MKKDQKFLPLVLFLNIILFAVFLSPNFIKAEISPENQYLNSILNFGMTSGTGHFFEITNSDYLNVVLTSSNEITLRMKSIPKTVSIEIEASDESDSTQITLSGFLPNTTYYKYQDDFHNLSVFVTDGEGKYSYVQDVSKQRLVIIQTQPSTKFITNNGSGGDCSVVGIWDHVEKVCTLTSDISETIQIDDDNITLDGNGYSVTGNGSSVGIFASGKSGLKIKNLNIINHSFGVFLNFGVGNIVQNNNFLNNFEAVDIRNSSENIISNNLMRVTSNIYFRYQGVVMFDSFDNQVKGNQILMNAHPSNFNNRQGIVVFNVDNSIFSENNISGAGQSILLFVNSDNNIFKYNNIENSSQDGFLVFDSTNNKIFNNNFISGVNDMQAFFAGNVFNSNMPFGGNYWSNFDTPIEGCQDIDSNNICDTPKLFFGGQDNFPWKIPNGWPEEPIEPERDPVILIPGITGSYLFKDYGDQEEIWVNVPKLISPGADSYLNDLAFRIDGTENPLFPISVGDIVRSVAGADIFSGLINQLTSDGYTEGTDLFVFPYDWRKSNSENAILLKNKINAVLASSGSSKVDIVAHSMGGLLAKKYIADEGGTKVDKLIFLGTPHLGAPKAFKVLMYGDDMGFNVLFNTLSILNPERLKIISQNMPTAYELVPSQKYISKNGGYVINSIDKNNPITYSYIGTKSLMQDEGRNSAMFPFAESLHNTTDNLSLSGIDVHNFIGCGTKTVGEITLKQKLSWTSLFLKVVEDFDLKYVNGDETVPLGSANDTLGASMYYAKKISHGSLPSAVGIKEGISAILKGETIPSSPNILNDVSSCNVSGKNVSVHSPVELHVYDMQGNHSGPRIDGDIENNIEGVQYDVIGNEKFAFLPDGQNFRIVTKALDVGTYDFIIKDQNANDQITATYDWLLTPIDTLQSKAEIFVGPNYPSSGYQLKIDKDGDGVFESAILANQEVSIKDHLLILRRIIDSLSLDSTTKNFLIVKINKVEKELEKNKYNKMTEKMTKLANKIEEYKGRFQNISLADKNALVNSINILLDELL